jgi:hypothetical protein
MTGTATVHPATVHPATVHPAEPIERPIRTDHMRRASLFPN